MSEDKPNREAAIMFYTAALAAQTGVSYRTAEKQLKGLRDVSNFWYQLAQSAQQHFIRELGTRAAYFTDTKQ